MHWESKQVIPRRLKKCYILVCVVSITLTIFQLKTATQRMETFSAQEAYATIYNRLAEQREAKQVVAEEGT